VRGELLIRLGRCDEARAELEHAIELCSNEREQTVLKGKLAAIRAAAP
jgi:predicted RNA polymerase sigma factor